MECILQLQILKDRLANFLVPPGVTRDLFEDNPVQPDHEELHDRDFKFDLLACIGKVRVGRRRRFKGAEQLVAGARELDLVVAQNALNFILDQVRRLICGRGDREEAV